MAPVSLLVFRQEDRDTGAHNMSTCLLARLSLLSVLNHGFVIEAKHGHESNITWSPKARQEDNRGQVPLIWAPVPLLVPRQED